MQGAAQQLCGLYSAVATVPKRQVAFAAKAKAVQRLQNRRRISVMAVDASGSSSTEAAAKYGWELEQKPDWSSDPKVKELPIAAIRRPLQMTRSNGKFGMWAAPSVLKPLTCMVFELNFIIKNITNQIVN